MSEGIDVCLILHEEERQAGEKTGDKGQSLSKSRKTATLAVSDTAVSRVVTSTPIIVLPPLLLVRLQNAKCLKRGDAWFCPWA